jgi:hypothetical protein
LVQDKQPKNNAQKLALFAYHRERNEGHTRFSRRELEPYFAAAKETPPQNFDRDFNKAVEEGWIHEDGADSYLTSRGLEAVESGFAGDVMKTGKKPRRAGAKAANTRRKKSKVTTGKRGRGPLKK